MNKILKNVIAAVGGAAVIAFAVAALIYVVYYGKSIQPSSYRSFSVSADGKDISIPDVAEFDFTVLTEGGKDLTALQKQNTDDANKAISYVKSESVQAKDIKTTYYNVSPRYQNYDCSNTVDSSGQTTRACPPPSIVGYTITQTVDVKIRDFSKIGDIVGGVVTNGANQVGSLNFTLDDPTSAQDAARAQAIGKAKVKAEGVAQAGGFRLGRLLNIQEGSNPYPVYAEKSYSMNSMGGGVPAAAPQPSVEPGSQETDVTVTLTYEIK